MKSALLLAATLAGMACSDPPSGLPSSSDGGSEDAAVSDEDGGAADASPPDAAALVSDISLDMGRAQVDLSVAEESFAADACELDVSEQCVGAAGVRRLLRFSIETTNLGDGDLALGPPNENPNYQYSECHGHYHFQGYASYRLLDGDGGEVLVGRKQAFCLLDSEPYAPGASLTPVYSCLNQGLQAGWADVYTAELPCQFLDITDLADGSYALEVEVNPDGLLQESSSANNIGSIPIVIGDPDLETPTEDCAPGAPRYVDRIQRECEWELAGEFDCTPGTQTGAGCSQNCGTGSCTGDPMIRVCDADEPNCTSATALGANNDRCGGQCPLANDFLCPDSGRLAVYTAAFHKGQAYTCDLVIGAGPMTP